MDVIVCTAGVGNVLRTIVCTSPTVLEAEVLWSGWKLSWWSHLAQNCSRNIECRKIQRRYSAFSATAKLWSRLSTWQCKMSRGSFLSRLFWTRITSVFFHGRHYHRICHQLNIYGINSVDVFTTVQIHRKHYRGCVTRLCTRGTTFHKPLSNGSMRRRCEAIVAARGGHTRYWTPQTSILHHNFGLSMICSDNDVEKFFWYCPICYAHMHLNYTIFVDFIFSM
jgi:hypothetical protein